MYAFKNVYALKHLNAPLLKILHTAIISSLGSGYSPEEKNKKLNVNLLFREENF